MNDLDTRIEEAFKKAMEDGAKESLEAYENLCKLRDVRDGQKKVVVPVQDKKEEQLTDEQKFVKALRDTLGAMPTGSTIAVPTEVSAQIDKKRYEFSNLRRYVTVHKATGNYSIQFEGTGVTVSYVSEGAAVGDGTPTLGSVTLGAYKLGALVKMSNEMIQDMAADISSEITTLIAKGFALKEDYEILLGAGASANAITGVCTAQTSKVVTLAAATPTWAEIKSVIEQLNGGYRTHATIFMSQALADAIHDFKDGTKYIFDQNAPIERILGIPVVISPDLSAPSASSKPCMVVGDFSYYHLVDRTDLNIVRLNELYAGNDQTGFKAIERIDGNVTLAEAFAVLKTKA